MMFMAHDIAVTDSYKMLEVAPCFWKIPVMPLSFYGRPPLLPVLANQKKSKEDFCF